MSAIYSATAQAIESPSYVDVPLPISSNITKLFSVASFRIVATSIISTINVLCPILKSSDAPTLVNILSTTPISASVAGTKHPTCAINVINATCLIYVDLPAILGPVIIDSLLSPLSKNVSFSTKTPSPNIFSITGCLPFFISIVPDESTTGMQ